MEHVISDYDLPDMELLRDEESGYRYSVWQPQQIVIIIGQSNKAGEAVFVEEAMADGIPIVRRPTGGQTVILSPRMLVVSAIKNGKPLWFKKYFEIYGNKIIEALCDLGISGLEIKGISDIVLRGRKISGSAMYHNSRRVFFHAVLNVAESPRLLERYLRYPRTAPEYRAGRSHADFVTSLFQEGFPIPPEEIRRALSARMSNPQADERGQ